MLPTRPGPLQADAGHRSPLGTALAELVWLRSLTGPHHPYLESADGTRLVTFAVLRQVADRWAALLDDLLVPPGATVGVAVADPVDFALVFVGVIAAGRVAGPLDAGATDTELGAACRRIQPHLVVASRGQPSGVAGEWLELPGGAFALGEPPPGVRAPALGDPLGPPGLRPPGLRPPGAGGLLLSSSGTTGVPKLVRLGERQLLHTAAAIAAAHELTVTDRGFNPLPLFHVNAEVVGLLAAMVSGATVVLDDRFHRDGFWDVVRSRRVTWVNAVPGIIARLSKLERGESVPPGVRFVRSASAPLPVAVLERFERETGIPVVETYGMTEAASQITATPVHGPRKPGSVGRPVGAEVRVVAGPAGTSAVGSVEIRGPGVIGAYAGPGYEDRFDARGWLTTGDLGYLDEDGYLFLVGRVDDVINRSGEKVYPREVEEVVLAHPGVSAAAVVGWDHEVLGRVPVAHLVLQGVTGPEDRGRAEDLVRSVQERCERELSRAKRPVAYHVVGQLPRGGTGKIRRSAVAGGSAIYSLLVR